MSDMWTDPAEDPRTYGNPVGEKATLQEYLANYRLTLELKCQGLTPEQLASRSVPPSTMSLLGLVRHMASVENNWFHRVLEGHRDDPRLYRSEDDRDLDFNGAVADQAVVDDAFATWKAEIAKAEAWVEAVAEADLGREVPLGKDDKVSIRDVLVHMVEEYARHAGHADLLRECIDGRTGQ
ncbi:DinB family protein [Nocardioides sp. Root140]|uniref:DinB family protein n=1 Tax=Nocardioides sp. Root140 TaxID=1736460 RepID=UPI000B09722D|nr:DinB family protein [Nocardioides sp. Root140]